MTFNGGNWGKRDSTQNISERIDSKDEQSIAYSYGTSLFRINLVSIFYWMCPQPILIGRWLFVAVVIFLAVKYIRPSEEYAIKYKLYIVLVCGFIAVGLVSVGLLDLLWYPVFWSWRDDSLLLQIGSKIVYLPLWFLWVRAFLIIAPPLAWDRSFRFVVRRFVTEILFPTASSPPIQQARASSILPMRGSPVVMVDPDVPPAQVIEYQPARIVPMRVQPNAVQIQQLVTASGESIDKDKVLDMIESQIANIGFAYDTWRNRGWTRARWDAAMSILEGSGIVKQRARGQATAMLISVDDALDVIERL